MCDEAREEDAEGMFRPKEMDSRCRVLQNVTEAWATESPGLCGWEVTERTDGVYVEALAETFTEDGSGLGMHLEERRQRRRAYGAATSRSRLRRAAPAAALWSQKARERSD